MFCPLQNVPTENKNLGQDCGCLRWSDLCSSEILEDTCLLDFFLLRWGLTTRQPLWVILCRFPEKGRKEIEEIVEEMKQRDREERRTEMKVKKQKK